MIGLSLLPTTHPSPFQRKLVRASSACYGAFTLVMGRSLGFASAPPDLSALLRLALASAHIPEGLDLAIMKQLVGSLCKRHAVVSRLRPLVNERFQVLFHSPLGVLPTFPSRYWSTIGLPEYLALRHGRRRFRQDSTCPALLRWHSRIILFTSTGLSPPSARLSRLFLFIDDSL